MAASADPFLWLEDVNGAKAMDWVKAENAKTARACWKKTAGFPAFRPTP